MLALQAVAVVPPRSASGSDPNSLKNLGNDCFKKGRYKEAAEYYNVAIDKLIAGGDNNVETLANCYQNRAAALEKLVG